jgi:polyisoprenoid-binding protein YceI
MSKLLQAIGVLALLGWTAAGFGAWMLTKEQVHITVEEGAGDRLAAVDPTAELADRFTALQGDLRGLAQSLGKNFELLEEGAVEREAEAASTRAGELAALRAELARLEQGFTAVLNRALESERQRSGTELARLTAELAALRATIGERRTGEPEGAAAAPTAESDPALAHAEEPASRTEAPSEAARIEPALEGAGGDRAASAGEAPGVGATEAGPAPEAPPAQPRKKRSFVAFDLPSDSFTFAGRRTWEIVPSLSRVGFDAKSTLHDFTGATQKISGSLTADLTQAAVEPQGEIRVEAASLNTGLADRDTAMYEKLETAKHGAITFTVVAFRPSSTDAQAMKLAGIVKGRLGIRGVEREVEMPVKLAVDDARRLSVEGELVAKMSLWGIEPPSQLGMISVQDEVKIWIALRARAAGAPR